MIKPTFGQARISYISGGVRLRIPPRTSWYERAFAMLMLAFMLYSLSTMPFYELLLAILHGSGGAVIGLLLFTGFAFLVLWSMSRFTASQLGGQQVVIRNGQLRTWTPWMLHWPRVFSLAEIRDLRVGSLQSMAGISFYGIGWRRWLQAGSIAFDYRGLGVTFAVGLDDATARSFLQKLKEKGLITDANLAP